MTLSAYFTSFLSRQKTEISYVSFGGRLASYYRLFGAASSPGCANFGLRHLADEGLGRFSEDTIHFIRRNFYVDNKLASVASQSKAIQLVKESRELCSTGKFRLHKFISNSEEVMATIPKEECVEVAKDLNMAFGEYHMERVLGVQWCVTSDEFQF